MSLVSSPGIAESGHPACRGPSVGVPRGLLGCFSHHPFSLFIFLIFCVSFCPHSQVMEQRTLSTATKRQLSLLRRFKTWKSREHLGECHSVSFIPPLAPLITWPTFCRWAAGRSGLVFWRCSDPGHFQDCYVQLCRWGRSSWAVLGVLGGFINT